MAQTKAQREAAAAKANDSEVSPTDVAKAAVDAGGDLTPATDPAVDTNPTNDPTDVPAEVIPDESDVPTDEDIAAKQAEISRIRAEAEALRQQIRANAEAANRVKTMDNLNTEADALRRDLEALKVAANTSAEAVTQKAITDSSVKGGDLGAIQLALENHLAQEAALEEARAANPGVDIEGVHPKDDPARQILVTNGLVTASGQLRAGVKKLLMGGTE